MRSLRLTAVTFVASCAVALAGCASDDPQPSVGDSTPTTETSVTPSDSGSTTPDSTDAADAGDVGDFPEVAGFSYRDLPGAVFQNLKSTIKGTPQVEDVQAKLVSKGGQEAGLVMRLAIDPETASVDGFEDGFLPGFAGGVAGSNAAPDYEDINGTNVVTVDVPGETGAAYAWLQGSVATVLVFKDAADAEAFAQAALG